MFPTVEAFWLSGQWPNTPVVATAVARSDADASASRALTPAPRTGTAVSDFGAAASRALIPAPRTGTARTDLDTTGSRALTLSATSSAYSNLDIAASRLLAAQRTAATRSVLDASATSTTSIPTTTTGDSTGGFVVSQDLVDALPWPDWVRGRTLTATGDARLVPHAAASRLIIETEDDAVALLLLA